MNAVRRVNATWISFLRRYFMFAFIANLFWEFAHIPLYTIWREGTTNEILFAVFHCTGGDILIAGSCLIGSMCVLGTKSWPCERYAQVAAATVISGIFYTILSEWLNTEIRGAWAYTEFMPSLPIIGTGRSPFLQWIVVPIAAFLWLRPKPSQTAP